MKASLAVVCLAASIPVLAATPGAKESSSATELAGPWRRAWSSWSNGLKAVVQGRNAQESSSVDAQSFSAQATLNSSLPITSYPTQNSTANATSPSSTLSQPYSVTNSSSAVPSSGRTSTFFASAPKWHNSSIHTIKASLSASPALSLSTIYTTITETITECPESVTDCPLTDKTTYSTVFISSYTTALSTPIASASASLLSTTEGPAAEATPSTSTSTGSLNTRTSLVASETTVSLVYTTAVQQTATVVISGSTSLSTTASVSTITTRSPSVVYITTTITEICYDGQCTPYTAPAASYITRTIVIPETTSANTVYTTTIPVSGLAASSTFSLDVSSGATPSESLAPAAANTISGGSVTSSVTESASISTITSQIPSTAYITQTITEICTDDICSELPSAITSLITKTTVISSVIGVSTVYTSYVPQTSTIVSGDLSTLSITSSASIISTQIPSTVLVTETITEICTQDQCSPVTASGTETETITYGIATSGTTIFTETVPMTTTITSDGSTTTSTGVSTSTLTSIYPTTTYIVVTVTEGQSTTLSGSTVTIVSSSTLLITETFTTAVPCTTTITSGTASSTYVFSTLSTGTTVEPSTIVTTLTVVIPVTSSSSSKLIGWAALTSYTYDVAPTTPTSFPTSSSGSQVAGNTTRTVPLSTGVITTSTAADLSSTGVSSSTLTSAGITGGATVTEVSTTDVASSSASFGYTSSSIVLPSQASSGTSTIPGISTLTLATVTSSTAPFSNATSSISETSNTIQTSSIAETISATLSSISITSSSGVANSTIPTSSVTETKASLSSSTTPFSNATSSISETSNTILTSSIAQTISATPSSISITSSSGVANSTSPTSSITETNASLSSSTFPTVTGTGLSSSSVTLGIWNITSTSDPGSSTSLARNTTLPATATLANSSQSTLTRPIVTGTGLSSSSLTLGIWNITSTSDPGSSTSLASNATLTPSATLVNSSQSTLTRPIVTGTGSSSFNLTTGIWNTTSRVATSTTSPSHNLTTGSNATITSFLATSTGSSRSNVTTGIFNTTNTPIQATSTFTPVFNWSTAAWNTLTAFPTATGTGGASPSSTSGIYTNTTAPASTTVAPSIALSSALYTNATTTAPVSTVFDNSTTSSASYLNTTSIASPTSTTSTSTCSATPSPTYNSACVRSLIPGCTPCEGQGTGDWCGLTLETNYYEEYPNTCYVVQCNLVITNTTMAPDGVDRMTFVVNGEFPGPLIEANWGDTVEVTVTNYLTANGTSMHFHGVRQLNTNDMDGVASITQCPIPGNGGSMTYTWVAQQYGPSWYHSHYSIQAWEGILGPVIINGPTTAEFDIDLGPVVVNDWLHTPVFSLFSNVERTGSPEQDNILINGRNVWENSDGSYIGERAQFVFTPGKKHRMQVVMASLDSTFTFSIDGHNMTVIATDFVPIVPYTTSLIKIAIGQRYDIIVEANQAVGDYWLRVDPLTYSLDPTSVPPCGATNVMSGNTRAIVHYQGSCGTPNSTAYAHDDVCEDESASDLVPWLPLNVGDVDSTLTESLLLSLSPASVYRWYLSGTTFQMYYDEPTLLDVYNNNTDYAGPLAIDAPTANEWVYVIIESPVPLSHPIHLHGHDFYVLGSGAFASYSDQALNLVNPPRRDVATLPIKGWIVLGFLTDNPGAWLMHCHLGWHVTMGFALQFIEQADLLRTQIQNETLTSNCAAYSAFAATAAITQDDSGV